jgi:hypothetical protein
MQFLMEAFREIILKKNSEKEQSAELMKRILVGAFYASQGLGNLVMALFLIKGWYVAGLAMMIRPFLEVASSLSLFTALTLFLPQAHRFRSKMFSVLMLSWLQTRELRPMSLSWVLGAWTSSLFGLFYVFVALFSYIFINQYSSLAIIILLPSLLIVVLNAVSVFFLYELTNNK